MKDLPCPPELWPRFSALLDAVLDLPEEARNGFLGALQGEDALLRPGLEHVLGRDTGTIAETFLRATALELVEDSFCAGQRIGPYRLEARLGEGGMGEVWRASRHDDGPRREVALKLPHALLMRGKFRKRFTLERDLLAALCHPHIAQLYDAGASAEGHPYLALELIGGVPITDFCKTGMVPLERRVDLILQVLQGLIYAHQRLIVHRDIKPSNILVTPEGSAKILDFGIAKMLTGETEQAAVTQALTRMATPAYAAPEQLDGAEITVGTDVFSVGVVMFELCTGFLPFPRSRLADQDAPLASTRVQAGAAGLPEKAPARHLRGDLDAIIAKAIANNPEERYASAEAFASDLRRWRGNLPVRARRIGWATALRKFLRRNRSGAILAAVLMVAVAAGVAGIVWQAKRAEAEAARAEAQARRANAVKDFLVDLFKQGNPNYGGRADQDMTARELLDLGAKRAEAAFAGDPATEAELQQMLAEMYTTDEDIGPALHAYDRRLQLTRAAFGETDRRTLDSLLDYAWQLGEVGRAKEGLLLMEPARRPILQRYGAHALPWAAWLDVHAGLLAFMPAQQRSALAEAREARSLLQREFPDTREYVDALFSLLHIELLNEHADAALSVAELARQAAERQQDFQGLDQVYYLRDKAHALEALGQSDAADSAYAEAQKTALSLEGKRRDYAVILDMRAHAASLRGDRGKAEAFFRESAAVPMAAADKSPALPPHDLAEALVQEGRAAEAAPLLRGMLSALAQDQQNWPSEDRYRHLTELLGDAEDQLGHAAEASRLLRGARDEALRAGFAGSEARALTRARWARFLLDQGDTGAAASEYEAVLAEAPALGAARALCLAGLARVALTRGDRVRAGALAGQALTTLAAVHTEYDVRAWLELWLTCASVAQARKDAESRDYWAGRAAEAAAAWCASGARWMTEARHWQQGGGTVPVPLLREGQPR